MHGRLTSIWRYPVKGFTPEPLAEVALTAGEHVPFDRLYAVEDGPCGFDPAAPGHISKQKFTVLAKIPRVAAIRTAFDDAAGVMRANTPGQPDFAGDLESEAGREAFAAWLTRALDGDVTGPLKVLPAPARHRFMDDPVGYVSIINLATLRALEAAIGRPVDPRRFRANLYVDGWPAWAEHNFVGQPIRAGGAELVVSKTIRRCVATHVDPDTAQADIEVVSALFDHFGHQFCGVYATVADGGQIRRGDAVVA